LNTSLHKKILSLVEEAEIAVNKASETVALVRSSDSKATLLRGANILKRSLMLVVEKIDKLKEQDSYE